MNEKTKLALDNYLKDNMTKESDVMDSFANITDILRNFDIGQQQPMVQKINARPIGPNPNFMNQMKALLPNLAVGSVINKQNPIDLFNQIMEQQQNG